MADITTRAGYLAAVQMPLGARLGFFEISNGPRGLTHVLAGVDGNTKLLALLGARAVLAVVSGKRAFIRIAPEADTQISPLDGTIMHVGYVRFAFKDEPGEHTAVAPDQSENMKYLGLEPMGEAEARETLRELGIQVGPGARIA